MEKAGLREEFSLEKFPDLHFGIVNWPMSVIRLNGKDKDQCAEAASFILDRFRSYSDESLSILSHTGDTPHNTITPIARKRGELFELDLVLRNNRTTEEHPLGLFHPHEERHHIKKENIGLIEVMGLAVLPARLRTELSNLGEAILENREFSSDPVLGKHYNFSQEIRKKYQNISKDTVEEIVRAEVGKVFLMVLRDAGIFKEDEAGKEGFRRFIASLS